MNALQHGHCTRCDGPGYLWRSDFQGELPPCSDCGAPIIADEHDWISQAQRSLWPQRERT